MRQGHTPRQQHLEHPPDGTSPALIAGELWVKHGRGVKRPGQAPPGVGRAPHEVPRVPAPTGGDPSGLMGKDALDNTAQRFVAVTTYPATGEPPSCRGVTRAMAT